MRLTDYTAYADAHRHFQSAALWSLFDGGRESLNIAVECLDRHAGSGRVAVRVAHADGRDETLGFRDLSEWSARFAHWLAARGVAPGDRVAIMLEPSLAFYAALFGAIKRGAIAVPLFTLFGPDGVRLRVEDCTPRLLLTNAEKADTARAIAGLEVVVADDAFAVHAGGAPGPLRGAERRRRPRGLSVHVGHDAGAAGCGAPSPARDRRAHGRSTLRHGHPAGRSLLLPVLARVGARPLARHARAAGARRHHRDDGRQVRSGPDAPRAAGVRRDQRGGRGDALSHAEELRTGRRVSLRHPQAVVHRRADGQRQHARSSRRRSARACAACTGRPRSV